MGLCLNRQRKLIMKHLFKILALLTLGLLTTGGKRWMPWSAPVSGVTSTTLATHSNPAYIYEVNAALDLPLPPGTTITIHTNTGGWVAGTYNIDGSIGAFTTAHGVRNLYYNSGQWGGSTDSITGGSYTLNP